MKGYIILLFTMLFPVLLLAQLESFTEAGTTTAEDSLETNGADIYIFEKSADEGLILRWAPANASTWVLGNKYGYRLEKKLVYPTKQKEFSAVGSGAFKPWPLKDWEPIVNDSTPFRAAAAMTIHGERKLENVSPGFVAQDQALQNRYGFALLSADLDKKAAEASGLRFLDSELERNSIVIYRIFIMNEKNEAVSDTSYNMFNYSDPEPFIASYLFPPTEGERSVTLKWEKLSVGNRYSGYYIERSSDEGKTFERRTETPFLDISTNLMKDKDFITYVDSVDQNYIPYQYRIIALDAFGDESEPSNVIIGMGRDKTAPVAPAPFSSEETAEHHIALSWGYEVEDLDFNGFKVYRSLFPKDGYTAISSLLDPAARSFTDSLPDVVETNYYYVAAVDTAGNEAFSIVDFAITSDDTPPSAPVNLRASIDTLGQMLLEWDAPADKDIRGYQVHYSNSIDEEFAVIPGDIIENLFYVDLVNLNTLTEEIHYYVLAMDLSYNTSVPSETLTVKKPDLIPPSPSIFVDYYVSEEGISFNWNKSTSDDVERVELHRKSDNNVWVIIEDFDQDTGSYMDKNVIEGQYYEYALHTIDDDGNITVGENNLGLEALKSYYLKDTPVLVTSREEEGVLLTIQYPNAENYKFTILRAKEDGTLAAYKVVGETSFMDTDIKKKTKYHYAVKANASDGRDSELSEEVMIKG